MTSLIIPSNNIPIKSTENPIVFISDLHFDFTKRKFKAKAALRMKDDFITFVKEHYSGSILCLAGDFFNSYKKTLSFVKELEKNQIVGFFVLGNHDYWNNGSMSHRDIINLFSDVTKDNQYFRFLVTGRKYYFNDICIVGDTGWTSFRRGRRQVELNQFMCLPDAVQVKDFNPRNIIDLHNEWVSFANDVLKKEEKVLIVTHFPMVNFTKEDKDCWWSSTTALKGDNSWRIFGHTHRSGQRFNNISSQRGYVNKDAKDLERQWVMQYTSACFGKIEKSGYQDNISSVSNFDSISNFHSPIVVKNVTDDVALILTVKLRGYKRCAANKHNFTTLANSAEAYLEIVKKVTKGYLRDTYIGYVLSGPLPQEVINAIQHSIEIIERRDMSDVRAFITAAVITGYVFNEMPFLIKDMRPLDDYDILRFWLMLLTINHYGINMESINTVRSDKKNPIRFCNVDLYVPAVNDLSLTTDEVEMLMHKTPLSPRPAVLLELVDD
ncbi:putative phosphohydrolase [Paenibacillus anaericanus]|uniref:metallophosphoesterase n=1 Tax=Paenibacillus anaericanus TaxID=170367 RepID=UPI00277F6ADE|nr:metallophosphoesterase [Paenibacillus anaericanus]MDQ0092079.1 putative phosphohydrolase [Paenibacillus anaericanus]